MTPTILVISPLYFPTEEGLAHYTTEFCRHLAKVGRVVVLTGVESAGVAEGPGSVEVLGKVGRWTWFGPANALRAALRVDPDVVLVQFVPFMYARRGGINLTIVVLSALLSLRAGLRGRGHVQVMFHELWYPFSWRLKDAIMHLAHRAMVFGLGVTARDRFCATKRFAAEVLENLGPFRKITHVLAVGSNLERDERSVGATPRSPTGPTKIALFGSLHPSKNVPMVLRALHDARHLDSANFELTVIGVERVELVRAVPELEHWLVGAVDVTGPLAADAAAERLAEHDFLLAYFQDGVSGRRGSLLAALCEGLPVVTTFHDDFSDEVFAGQPFVELLSCDETRFRDGLRSLLRTSERPFSRVERRDVRRFYDEHFSWAAVIRRYATLSGFDRANEPGLEPRLPSTVRKTPG